MPPEPPRVCPRAGRPGGRRPPRRRPRRDRPRPSLPSPLAATEVQGLALSHPASDRLARGRRQGLRELLGVLRLAVEIAADLGGEERPLRGLLPRPRPAAREMPAE